MGTQRLKQSLFFGLCVFFMVAGLANAEKKVTVVGSIECLDCAEKNLKAAHAFKGLRVAIKCKSSLGKYETKGVSQLDKSGNFHVNLPTDLLHEESSTLKPECLAELRDKSNSACPKPDPLALILASKEKDQHTFTIGTDGKMHLISSICSSETFWPPYKYKWDPFHKFSFPWKKPFPKYSFPPKPYTPVYKPTPTPVYKPTPTPVPVYKPTPTPVYKPTPTPVYKPTPTPVYKPTPTPVYKPTPTPVYKPTPTPVYKPTPTPVYKPTPTPTPFYKPPLYKFPPLFPHPKYGFPPIYKPPFFKKKHPWFPPTEKKN